MPALEIPAELRDSSPDSSVSVDNSPPATPPTAADVHVAAAQIHIRVQPPPPPLPPPPDLPGILFNPMPQQRRFSYDRDLPEDEEDNHWPGRPYLLPVVLPQVTEPTLDELLRRVTGRNDLQNVDSVKLRVISYMVSLSRLSLFLPRLANLDLSGSVLNSLRDLGCGLLHLTQLNVSNCGLSSFDGTSGLPSVQVLIADGNMVQLVGPLADLTLLKSLSARNNRIGDLGTLSFLGMCRNLQELQLQGNPVTSFILYRLTLQRSISTLRVLDGEPMLDVALTEVEVVSTPRTHAQPDAESSSESETPISSLSSDIYSAANSVAAHTSSNSSLSSLSLADERPATTCGFEVSRQAARNEQQGRPATASTSTPRRSLSLVAATPLVGSVLAVARQRKRHVWGNSTSSSSSFSSAASSPAPSSPGHHFFANRSAEQQAHQPALPPISNEAHASLSSLEELHSHAA